MEFGIKFLVLLAFGTKLAFCQDCLGNQYRNNQKLIKSMSGWLYTITTSKVYSNNEIFNCDVSYLREEVYCRTTNDAGCCKSFNISTHVIRGPRGDSKGYFPYVIQTDPDCPQQLKENAHMKLIASHNDPRTGIYCFSLWTCRPSREGFHVFCDDAQVSASQQKWIDQQFRKNGLIENQVEQIKDYRNGTCFPKAQEFDFFWY